MKQRILRYGSAAFLLFLLFFGKRSMRAVMDALSFCLYTLVPTLFPFLAATELFMHSGACERIGRGISPLTRCLFGISDAATGALLLGWIGGFPIGAHAVGTLYRAGQLEKAEAERLLLFCHLPSLPFTVYTVGLSLFGSCRVGFYLWLSAWISGFLTGCILQRLHPLKKSVKKNFSPSRMDMPSLSAVITSAGGALLRILGTVLFFSSVASLFSAVSGAPETLKSGVLLALELTTGLQSLAPFEGSFALLAAAGGIGENENGATRFYCAQGEILARTEYTLSCTFPLSIIEKQYISAEYCKKTWFFFGKPINFFKNYGNLATTCDTIEIVEKFALSKDAVLPLFRVTVRYLPYIEVTRSLDTDEAIQRANTVLQEQIAALCTDG